MGGGGVDALCGRREFIVWGGGYVLDWVGRKVAAEQAHGVRSSVGRAECDSHMRSGKWDSKGDGHEVTRSGSWHRFVRAELLLDLGRV